MQKFASGAEIICRQYEKCKHQKSKKRTAASHVLVFMIADELRNKKPYAIPVRSMP